VTGLAQDWGSGGHYRRRRCHYVAGPGIVPISERRPCARIQRTPPLPVNYRRHITHPALPHPIRPSPSLDAELGVQIRARTGQNGVAERHSAAAVVIPPRATSVAGETTAAPRDRHLAMIARHGRIGWQRRSGYNSTDFGRNSGVSLQVRHRSATPGPNSARAEAKVGRNVLNRMTALGMPTSVRTR
jgi:hypothetical protein